jgi:hypothetical protein
MLSVSAQRRLTRIVVVWFACNILLQSVIHFGKIEYDSPNGMSLIWWIAQIAALPVVLVSELSRSIGAPVSGYGGYIVLICLLALVFIGLIRVASASR